MKKLFFLVLIAILIIGCTIESQPEDNLIDAQELIKLNADLIDVTKSQEVQGINTNEKSNGVAKATYKDNQYNLIATFENLPDPNGTDFYEGWIVRKGIRFNVISTGRAKKIEGKYVNEFQTDQNLIDHDFYVLTIEPDDGDPAPAGHILEGKLK
jgi:hypothetical protein